MIDDLYSVMVNSDGGLEFPLKQSFLENNNLVTKDEVSELVGNGGLVAHPKDTGYAGYPNNVGSKGWYVSDVGLVIGSDTPRAVIGLTDTIPETLGKLTDNTALQNDNNTAIDPSDDSYASVNDTIKTNWGFEIGDRLTIICQECDFGSYTGSGQFQAILKVVGYNDQCGLPIVELDTSEPYCDTTFNRGTAGEPTLEKIFYAWLNNQPNESLTDEETKALTPDINTVRVYGKPELGVVDVLTSAVVEGIGNEASGQGSQAFGRRNKVTGTGSVAFGRNHLVAGYASTSLGQNNKVYGEKNLASGIGNTTYGLYSTAIGKNNTVGEKDSGDKETNVAIGTQNTINGSCAAGIGYGHNVSGRHSVALAESNKITSDKSFAAGAMNNLLSTGKFHVALGYKNNISGNCAQSVAIGSDNSVSHTNVYEFGTNLKSSDRDQTILGRFNADLPIDTEFAIGVGTDDTNRKTLVRANATKLFVNDSPVVTEAGCNRCQIGISNSTADNYALTVGIRNSTENNFTLTVGNTNTNNSENGFVAGKFNTNGEIDGTHYASTNLLGEYLKQSPRGSSTVVGTYNDPTKPYLFSVGAGTDENNRKNCFAVRSTELFADVTTANINVKNNVKIASNNIKLFEVNSTGFIVPLFNTAGKNIGYAQAKVVQTVEGDDDSIIIKFKKI